MKSDGLTRRTLLAAPFAVALPGYRYSFPRDHFSHPEFRTEWWYYTGNLFHSTGRRFGFELTFFRQAESPPDSEKSGAWNPNPIWLAHLALSDIGGAQFHHAERLNRSGPGLAGASLERGIVWNGNWRAGLDQLRAVSETFMLELRLDPRKPPVIHGADGISQKAEGEGRASHYISLTRIQAAGALDYEGERFELAGSVWMDHEFFTHQLDENQTGWDWLSIQLDDETELMLFRLRRRDGSADPYSAGTFVASDGRARRLNLRDFRLTPGASWDSPKTGASYPLEWRIEVPSLRLVLDASAPLSNQELVSRSSFSPTYWEGAMDFRGTRAGRPVTGVGYLEMTGYDKPVAL